MSAPLLEVSHLRKGFPVRRGLLQRTEATVQAVDDVSFEVRPGECVALVGESGSGKTTIARCVMRLESPSSGGIRFAGEDLLALRGEALRRRRRGFQMVFQDPYGSLDPRLSIGATLAEPLAVHRLAARRERPARVAALLARVGLDAELATRYPHELSGGQRQRVAIARALATEPRLLVADEPVSALDVSVRAQVLNLLLDLRLELGLAILLIAHDLALVEHVADRVIVLYAGQVVETGAARQVLAHAGHPYTASLLASSPSPTPPASGQTRRQLVVSGEPASPTAPPSGCRFHPRCPLVRDSCRQATPPTVELAAGHLVACPWHAELAALAGSAAQPVPAV